MAPDLIPRLMRKVLVAVSLCWKRESLPSRQVKKQVCPFSLVVDVMVVWWNKFGQTFRLAWMSGAMWDKSSNWRGWCRNSVTLRQSFHWSSTKLGPTLHIHPRKKQCRRCMVPKGLRSTLHPAYLMRLQAKLSQHEPSKCATNVKTFAVSSGHVALQDAWSMRWFWSPSRLSPLSAPIAAHLLTENLMLSWKLWMRRLYAVAVIWSTCTALDGVETRRWSMKSPLNFKPAKLVVATLLSSGIKRTLWSRHWRQRLIILSLNKR